MDERYYDLVIIGGGMGGYSAALRARKYGKSVAIVEKERIGGTCLNRGCIPTKAFLHIAKELKNKKLHSYEYKKSNEKTSLSDDIANLIQNKISIIIKGLKYTIDQAGIDVFHGKAIAKDNNTVGVTDIDEDGQNSKDVPDITYQNLIIATGAIPFVPCDIELGTNIFTTDEAFKASNIAFEKIAIVGGGVIGVEFASIYSDLGKDVTIIEPLDDLASGFSKELSGFVRTYLQKKGVSVRTSTRAIQITEEDDEVYLILKNSDNVMDEMLTDKALICTGRKAKVEQTFTELFGLDLHDNGAIKVNSDFETSKPGVYAVGDVSSETQLAYTASKSGEKVVDDLYSGKTDEIGVIPKCIYMDIEIAQVGHVIDNEEDETYIAEKISLKLNGRAVVEGQTFGFIRMTAEKNTGVLTGIEMAAPNAVDNIQLCKTYIDERKTVDEISDLLFPHPSYIEIIKDAAKAVNKKIKTQQTSGEGAEQ